MEQKYNVVNGTSYHIRTKKEIIDVLEQCRKNRTRIVVDYGDTVTGKSWNEENDTIGYVSRSNGNTKIPILVFNNRSTGGGALMDHCIVKISTTKGKKVLYIHYSYQLSNN
jgi:hypothetical protein